MRPVNKRGKLILKDTAKVEKLLADIGYSPTLEEYVNDGRTLAVAVAACIHEDGPASEKLEGATRGWRAAGRYYTTGGLGRVIRQQALSGEDAAMRLRSGDWDPFAAAS